MIDKPLRISTSAGGEAVELAARNWRLSIPAGPVGEYRLAQIDDYAGLARKQFLWEHPVRISLTARASSQSIPGTWGFGLWNDPFSLSLGLGGGTRRLPALPNAAWFFFASPPNYLSLRDDLPAQGALAATFRSSPVPALLLGLGAPALPFLAWPPAARLFRRLGRKLIGQDAVSLSTDATEWHTYTIDWQLNQVIFQIDSQTVLETNISPRPPLGLVLWIDNQYAALPPDGRLTYGNLANEEPAWIEIENLSISTP